MTQTTTAAINYNDETWGLSLQVPYLHRTHGTEGQTANGGADYGSNYSESDASGLGDVRVIGHYSGWFDDKTTGIIAGVKFAYR